MLKSYKLKRLFLLLFLFIVTTIIVFNDNGSNYKFSVLLTSFLIAALSLLNIFNSNSYPFSLNQIFYLYSFFFLGVAPALQFKNNIVFWGKLQDFTAQDYLEGNFIFLFSLILYKISYKWFSRGEKEKQLYVQNPTTYEIKKIVVLIISLISITVFFWSKNFDLHAILVRGGGMDNQNTPIINSSINLIINIFVRPIPVVALLYYRLYAKNNHLFFELFLFLLVILSNSPLGMPRFQVAAIYIPLAILYFGSLKKHFNLALSLFIGLLFVFPFLDQFRKTNSLGGMNFSFKNDILVSPHFDSYQNTLSVFLSETVTWGSQILGVIFFYVPRSLWVNKPIGSGAYFADKNNYIFSNISMSYFGEGFINFGYIGLFGFVILLGFINAYLDKKYWYGTSKYKFYSVLYLVLLGMEFFVLRGDLLSSFAYTIGLTCTVILVFHLIVKKRSYNE